MGKDVCLVKQMAMERGRKGGVFGILLWRSLYFMSLQIGAFGSFLSRSYIHGSRSVSFPFRHSLSLPLGAENHDSRTFLFACVTAHDPNCARTYVSSSELERERERKRKMRAQRSVVHSGVTLCLSKLEHLTPERWLIFHAASLPI